MSHGGDAPSGGGVSRSRGFGVPLRGAMPPPLPLNSSSPDAMTTAAHDNPMSVRHKPMSGQGNSLSVLIIALLLAAHPLSQGCDPLSPGGPMKPPSHQRASDRAIERHAAGDHTDVHHHSLQVHVTSWKGVPMKAGQGDVLNAAHQVQGFM